MVSADRTAIALISLGDLASASGLTKEDPHLGGPSANAMRSERAPETQALAGRKRPPPLPSAKPDAISQREAVQADSTRRTDEPCAARRNVSIVMYSTSWCGACVQARQYMREQTLSFTDHDVEQDADARARAHVLNPRRSVPVLDVEGNVTVGFSAPAFEASLDRAARKRVGL